MGYLIRARLSWLRFLGFDLGASTPDTNPIQLFREKLSEAGALVALFFAFDRELKQRDHLAMGGQVVDAAMVAASKQRKTGPEKAAKYKVHANVEHVSERQEAKTSLFIRTIGIKRAEPKVSLTNLAYNPHRLVFHERRATMV